MLAHIGATGKKLQPVVPRQIRDERLVRFRIRPAQPVIEVRNSKHDAQLGLQLQQNTQHRDGVRAAGHGHGNAVARAHQPSFANVVEYLRAHEKMVMQPSAFSHQPSTLHAVILSDGGPHLAAGVEEPLLGLVPLCWDYRDPSTRTEVLARDDTTLLTADYGCLSAES